MQVQAFHKNGLALCASDPDEPQYAVNCALLDEPPAVGDWLLVHVDVAVKALEAAEAGAIADALAAVTAAAAGEPFEHLLGDLADREPELPPHLRNGSVNA